MYFPEVKVRLRDQIFEVLPALDFGAVTVLNADSELDLLLQSRGHKLSELLYN